MSERTGVLLINTEINKQTRASNQCYEKKESVQNKSTNERYKKRNRK